MMRAWIMLMGLAVLCILSGCTTGENGARLFGSAEEPDVQVSEAQACAIGYDLARAIHERVSLRKVVIVAPGKASACERHTLDYLRQSGFRIDETGQTGTPAATGWRREDPPLPAATGAPAASGVSFGVELARLEGGLVSAIATIGSGLRIARLYLPVQTGVIAQGAVSVQHLDPDTYAVRGGS